MKKHKLADQLRKDKIIYAIESVAINTFCLLAFISADYIENYLFPFLNGIVKPLSILFAFGYLIFMGIGNFIRLQKIKQLEI